MIAFSLAHRTDATNPGWALFATTTESPDSPAESVTICMVVRSSKSAAMVDLVKAAAVRACSVYVQDLSDAEAALLTEAGHPAPLDEMPEAVSTFLSLAGSAK